MSKKIQLKDTYVGATELANILGINADTLRKRAKAGKIPAKQGTDKKWTFSSAELAAAGIEPFKSQYKTNVEQKLTDVYFVLDRSGSMNSFMAQAIKNLQGQLDELRKAAGPNDRYRVTVINFDTEIDITARSVDIDNLEAAQFLYKYARGSTRLLDAIGEAVRLAKDDDTGSKQHAFLISVVTDGFENASQNESSYSILAGIKQLHATDRYTFVYAGPPSSRHVATSLGFPDGNVTTWDQTDAGMRDLGMVTNYAINNYTRYRSAGVTNSTSFYAAPVTNDASKFANQLDDKLFDVSSKVKVERVGASDPVVIRKFCEKKFGSFPKGHIYYPLVKSEKVQDYKQLIVQDTTTGNFYTGGKAKQLLGIPNFQGTVHIKPGELGEFKVFVQSTSENRKLPVGGAVVYLP